MNLYLFLSSKYWAYSGGSCAIIAPDYDSAKECFMNYDGDKFEDFETPKVILDGEFVSRDEYDASEYTKWMLEIWVLSLVVSLDKDVWKEENKAKIMAFNLHIG